MAVIGMIVVIVCRCPQPRDIPSHLPIRQVVLDHRHLPPTLTKNAGTLMMEARLKDLYFKAWKGGSLIVTEQQSAKIKTWIAANETNKVWDFCIKEGERQKQAGTFTFSAADQRTIDRLQEKIDTEFLIDVDKMFYTDGETHKKHNLAKMDWEEIMVIYADLLGVEAAIIEEQVQEEVRTQVLNNYKASTPDLSDAEYAANLDLELQTLGEGSPPSPRPTSWVRSGTPGAGAVEGNREGWQLPMTGASRSMSFWIEMR